MLLLKERMKIFFPTAEIDVLEYNGTRKEAKYRCKKCGKEYFYNEGRKIFNQMNFCCSKDFKSLEEKIKYFSTIYNFSILNYNCKKGKVTIQCNNCKKIVTKTIVTLKQFPNACECKSYPKTNIEELQKQLDDNNLNEYQLLETNGANGECLIKHLNCGFIFKIRFFHDLISKRNRGCPKCYKFKSRGEQAIQQYLEEHQIKYIPQKTFSPLNKSKYRFDFFLPDYNLAIEYQGEQHYRDNGYFRDGLDIIQERDNIKKQYCLKNNIELLEISYKQFKNISNILSSRFNDYPIGSKDKCSEKNDV